MGFLDIRQNPLVLTDAYNLYHGDFKINTDWETSHIYNRKNGMILFGFNELVTSFLGMTITHDHIKEAEKVAESFGLQFTSSMWRKVVDDLHGKIPLRVQALPDGTWCPPNTPFAQISNTVEGFGEIVTWFEAIFLHNYFASSCATEAAKMFVYLEKMRRKYGYDESFMSRFHSFGFRGHRSLEDAYWAGTAWSLFLTGSDDLHVAKHFPECDLKSIPALAHKVVQQFDHEYDCFKRAIDVAADAKQAVVALVIDTWDAYNVINKYVQPLAMRARSKGIKVVFRPDSGDTWKQAADIYDICHEHQLDNVGVIIGEGMSLAEAMKADRFFIKNNVPLNFIAYGIGAGFYKHIERDTLGYAMKTSWSNGQPRMKFSENPLKRSIPGRVKVFKRGGELWVAQIDEDIPETDMYVDIYRYDPDGSIHMLKDDYVDTKFRATVSLIEVRRHMEEPPVDQPFIRSTERTKDIVREFKRRYRTHS